jgi:cytidyltransferase-like protein
MTKTVLVSGCFDLLHAGHVAFLKSAAEYGHLHVCIGADRTIYQLKHNYPLMTQHERQYILESLECVEKVHIGTGSGLLDFEPELRRLSPDVLVVNEDGHHPDKAAVCQQLGIEYVVLDRVPDGDLPARSSTGLKKNIAIPYRLALSGGWIDQPFMSKVCPGDMVVVSLEPSYAYNDRSGMATSSRKTIMEIWGQQMPRHASEKLARILFAAENPPGTEYVSGSQDMIGLAYPGISHLHYSGEYWPDSIESTLDPDIIDWLEDVIYLIELWPRPDGFDPLAGMNTDPQYVRQLGESGQLCWEAILDRDIDRLGKAFDLTNDAWQHLVPSSLPEKLLAVREECRQQENCAGVMVSGAGGGGYLIIASRTPVPHGMKIKVRV